MPDNLPPVSAVETAFRLQRRAFAGEPNPTLPVRRDRLDRLLALTEGHEREIVAAIDQDFGGRSPHETRLSELFIVRGAIGHARRHLRRWMRPRRVPTGIQFRPGYNRLLRQPLGVVGIISPWNYPFQLALAPALAAIAAGNRVLIKPSELTPAFSSLLGTLVGKYFNADEMAVVTGDADVGRAFSALPFDHLFFTGSTAIGRIVAQQAAANLTPVTLELGGKSPAILDASCDVAAAASSIAFGKFLNAGQTCVAPDYLLVPRGQAGRVAEAVGEAVSKLYPTLARNPDYTAVISVRHRQRLTSMLDEARAGGAAVTTINPANEALEGSNKIAPTLVTGAGEQTRLLREEIFGPVLPIVEYDGVESAISYINARDRPLALYWYGRDHARRDKVLNETIAGGVTINDCLWQLAQEEQPFGGVGPSGTGAYHGEWGFRTFSKEKPVFYQSRLNGTKMFHPPYGRRFDRLLALLNRIT
jgi:coniferyl-aldehyde dehydrogenase